MIYRTITTVLAMFTFELFSGGVTVDVRWCQCIHLHLDIRLYRCWTIIKWLPDTVSTRVKVKFLTVMMVFTYNYRWSDHCSIWYCNYVKATEADNLYTKHTINHFDQLVSNFYVSFELLCRIPKKNNDLFCLVCIVISLSELFFKLVLSFIYKSFAKEIYLLTDQWCLSDTFFFFKSYIKLHILQMFCKRNLFTDSIFTNEQIIALTKFTSYCVD